MVLLSKTVCLHRVPYILSSIIFGTIHKDGFAPTKTDQMTWAGKVGAGFDARKDQDANTWASCGCSFDALR